MQKNVTPGRRKGCPNYPPEFKQQLVAASCEPGISISKLALENGINANLLFKWRQQWREGKLLLPSSESPQLLPVTLDAAAEQPESLKRQSVVQMATTMARGKAAITFFREPPATSCDSRCSCRTARIARRGPGNPQYQL
ncbi:IS66-like element accessory protein TnpA [Escherichia coli]|uniref:IS66-like element accessory protein TnpA n=2 Tax=Escherichia coli TaxID=562 RepID=UPI00237F3D5C|nr:transposase [Escherichia coli]